MKKFQNIEEFVNSEEFKNKDLSYCDLSNLDLGCDKFPVYTWKDFTFYHTNFKNTNIFFQPQTLARNYHARGISLEGYKICKLEYCDFTGCDLSRLYSSEFDHVSITGSNFTDTGLNIRLFNSYGEDIEHEWMDLGYRDYSEVIFPKNDEMKSEIQKIGFLGDYHLFQNCPEVPFDSVSIYKAMKNQFKKVNDQYITSEKQKELIEIIDQYLEEDRKREGHLVKLFDILNQDSLFSDIDKIKFAYGKVENNKFGDIDFSTLPIDLLSEISYIDCEFKSVKFPNNLESSDSQHIIFQSSKTPYVIFPTINPSSWQNIYENKVGFSNITFRRNLYLELGRFCNGKCKFCRNQFLPHCKYDFDAIKNSLLQINPYLDYIVVGGGEPTFLTDDLKELKNISKDSGYRRVNWIVFTNASCSMDKLVDLSHNGFDFNISRHSCEDDINDRIFGVPTLKFEDIKKAHRNSSLSSSTLTLCATCFKGDGIDSVRKMEDYIGLASEISNTNVMFQTLHKDLNSDEFDMDVLPIEDEIFDEMIALLKEQGYDISIPIYSTGDYKLILAKKGNQNISFKRYITPEQLQVEWNRACKRTFDLSMDPSGNVYQNWHQSADKVLLKK